MTVVPERVLAAHRLGRFIGRIDVADCSAAVHAITDSGVRAYIAHSIRAQTLEEIYDAVSEPDCNLSAAGMMDLTKRRLRRMQGTPHWGLSRRHHRTGIRPARG